jgi:hypothetical protein
VTRQLSTLLRNLERKAPKHALADLRTDFHQIVYASSAEAARIAYEAVERKWEKRCPAVVKSLRKGGASRQDRLARRRAARAWPDAAPRRRSRTPRAEPEPPWLEPVLQAEVTYAEMMQGRLRNPVFRSLALTAEIDRLSLDIAHA